MKAIQDVTVSIHWNDNNNQDGARPSQDELLNMLTIAPAVSVTPAVKVVSYNEWAVTWPGLPSGTYQVTQTQRTGYLPPAIDGLHITNTTEAVFSVTKQWRDFSTAAHTRAAFSAYLASLTLYRSAKTMTAAQIYEAAPVITADGDKWVITYTGLPAFDPLGNPYTYHVTDSYQWTDNETNYGSYHTVYENIGSHAYLTNGAYHGGTILSTIVNERAFYLYKVWAEPEGTDPATRPNITFRLFRYPAVEGFGVSDGSPVRGMDSMSLSGAASSTGERISYQVGGNESLPMYDNMGRRYLYFVRETIGGNEAGYRRPFRHQRMGRR